MQTSKVDPLPIADIGRLFAVLMAVALTIAMGTWVGFAAKLLLSKFLPLIGGIAMLTIDLGSIALGIWLLFRRIQPQYTKGEAKAAATAFVLFSPIMIATARFFANELLPYLTVKLHLRGFVVVAGTSMGGIVLAVSLFFIFFATAIGWTRLLSHTS